MLVGVVLRSKPLQLVLLATVTLGTYALFRNHYTQNSDQVLLTKSLHQFLTDRSFYEGRFVWEATGIEQSKVKPLLGSGDEKRYHMLVCINSLVCMSCYRFHIQHIAAMQAAFNLPVIVVADSQYAKFVAGDLPRAEFIIDSEPREVDFLVLMLDGSGKVLYADLPDPALYEESKIFYKTIKHLLARATPSS